MSAASEKLPVERLRQGDVVRAVDHGPNGKVIDANRCGWTIVEYRPGKVLPYEHGKDRLFLVEAVNWKANHDHQAAIKRDVHSRYDALYRAARAACEAEFTSERLAAMNRLREVLDA